MKDKTWMTTEPWKLHKEQDQEQVLKISAMIKIRRSSDIRFNHCKHNERNKPREPDRRDATRHQGRTTSVRPSQVKLKRAQGGCLGTKSRRRTWQAAKSCGEEQISIDPQISECGNTAEHTSVIITWIHSVMRGTGRTETSKYPQEEKETSIPSVVASERGRA